MQNNLKHSSNEKIVPFDGINFLYITLNILLQEQKDPAQSSDKHRIKIFYYIEFLKAILKKIGLDNCSHSNHPKYLFVISERCIKSASPLIKSSDPLIKNSVPLDAYKQLVEICDITTASKYINNPNVASFFSAYKNDAAVVHKAGKDMINEIKTFNTSYLA